MEGMAWLLIGCGAISAVILTVGMVALFIASIFGWTI